MKGRKITAAATMAAAVVVFGGGSAHAVGLDNTFAFDTNITSGGSTGSHKVTSTCGARV